MHIYVEYHDELYGVDDRPSVPASTTTVRTVSAVSGLSGAFTRVGNSSWVLSASWSPLSDALSYTVSLYYKGSFQAGVSASSATTSFNVTSTGEYIITVVPVYALGFSGKQTSVTVAVTNAPLVVPDAPTGLVTEGSYRMIKLTVTYEKPDNFDYVEIYAADVNNREFAVLVGTTLNNMSLHQGLNNFQSKYYWARVKAFEGVYSDWFPAASDGGVLGTSATSTEQLLDDLKGALGSEQFTSDMNEKIELTSLIPDIETAITGPIAVKGGIVSEDAVIQSAAGVKNIYGNIKLNKQAIQKLQTDSGEQETRLADAELNITAMLDDMGDMTAKIEQKASVQTVTELSSQYAAVEETLTATKNDVDGLKAIYMLKIDVNGHVAAVKLYGSEEESAFSVLSDKFFFVAPDGSGEPRQIMILGEVGGEYQLGLDGSLIIKGSINGDVISAVSRILLKDGGAVILGNNNIIMDTAGTGSGSIVVAPDGGTAGHDYVVLSNGDIQFYYYDSSTSSHVQYKSLRRVESGVAYNNTSVSIPGVWKTQPKIILTPANLQSYDSEYAAQDQKFLLEATALAGTNGRYSFTPKAQLVLSSASLAVVLNYVAANNSSAVYGAGTATSPANTVSITVNVKLKSTRGTGTAGAYYLRTVYYRINYGTGQTAYKSVAIGATLDSVADSLTVSNLSANSYNVSVEAYAVDTGGTFSTGGTQYEYWSGTSNYMSKASHPVLIVMSGETLQLILPDLSIPSGYSVYQVTWDLTYGSTGTGGSASGVGMDYSAVIPGGQTTGTVKTTTGTTFDATAPTINFTANASAQLTIQNLVATVYARKAVTNSTTPENILTFESASYSLSAAQVLAEGTVNWMAMGD